MKYLKQLYICCLFALLALVSRAQTTADKIETAKECMTLAEELLNSSLELAIWKENNPSFTAHLLLTEVNKDKPGPRLTEWLNGGIKQVQITELHRGEFLSILAEHEVPPNYPIKFNSGAIFKATDILDYEQSIFSFSNADYFNSKEQHFGQEYGWLLKGFLGYLNPENQINETARVMDIGSHLLEIGINRNVEEGVHDLEALARLKKELSIYEPQKNLRDEINIYLKGVFQEELTKADDTGQLYAYSSHFDGHKLEDKSDYAIILDNLSRQAHFIEWTSEAGCIDSAENYELIIGQFKQLLLDARIAVEQRKTEVEAVKLEDILVISAVSHAWSATNKHLKLIDASTVLDKNP